MRASERGIGARVQIEAQQAWYSSGTFLAAAAIAIALVAIPIGAWANFASAGPRRELSAGPSCWT